MTLEGFSLWCLLDCLKASSKLIGVLCCKCSFKPCVVDTRRLVSWSETAKHSTCSGPVPGQEFLQFFYLSCGDKKLAERLLLSGKWSKKNRDFDLTM